MPQAFPIADSILRRLRTIPASFSRLSFFFRTISSDLRGVEFIQGHPVVLAFLENRLPTQPGLCSFEHQELEQAAVVMNRHAPFLVVVLDVLLPFRPRTPNTCRCGFFRRRSTLLDFVRYPPLKPQPDPPLRTQKHKNTIRRHPSEFPKTPFGIFLFGISSEFFATTTLGGVGNLRKCLLETAEWLNW
jgi:hypothetical protein